MTTFTTARSVSNPASWTTPAAPRASAEGRVSAVPNVAAAASTASGDDPFAKALERSREAARVQTAQETNRSNRPNRTNEERPDTVQERLPNPSPVQAPVPAPAPAVQANVARPPDADSRDDTKKPDADASTHTDGPGGASTATMPPREADAAAHKARAAAAAFTGKPFPGSAPVQEEVKEPVICYAPENPANDAAAFGAASQSAARDAALLAANAANVANAANGPNGPNGQVLNATGDTSPTSGIVKRAALGDSGLLPSSGGDSSVESSAALAAATGFGLHVQAASGPLVPPDSESKGGSGTAVKAAPPDFAAVAGAGSPPTDPGAARSAPYSADPFTLVTRPVAPHAPESTLSARPGTADFAPQLGAQLVVWVRDGMHEARLQLNPADMGPVRVEIQLDGTAAQVSLSASNEMTRQALQDALPSLAGSLREAGFTLAGGGVFDQPPQEREGHAGNNGNSGRSADIGRLAADGSTQAGGLAQPMAARARGLVDLVA